MFLLWKALKWAVLVTVLLVAALGATAWFFVWPSGDEPRRAHAVVVLDGGDGERLDRALDLMADKVAPVLVVYGGKGAGTAKASRLCEGDAVFEVICPVARKDGPAEAKSLAGLAYRRSWHSLVVVTSTYDVTKARLLVDRCFDGKIAVVESKPSLGKWVRAVPDEWAGYFTALVVERGC